MSHGSVVEYRPLELSPMPQLIFFGMFQYQGDDFLDTDIPTPVEAKLFCTTFGKLIWVALQPIFYMLRPLFVNPKAPIPLEFLNTVVQLSFDFAVVYFLGKFLRCNVWQLLGL